MTDDDNDAFESVGIRWVGMMTDDTVRVVCDTEVTIHQIESLELFGLYLYKISPLVGAFKLEFMRNKPILEEEEPQ